ncbi:MAG: hypothetical protein R2778_06910 [Saprospiraceae bacterium]
MIAFFFFFIIGGIVYGLRKNAKWITHDGSTRYGPRRGGGGWTGGGGFWWQQFFTAVAAASVAAVDLAVVASEVAEQVVAGKPCRFINLIQFKLSKTRFTVYKTLIHYFHNYGFSFTGFVLKRKGPTHTACSTCSNTSGSGIYLTRSTQYGTRMLRKPLHLLIAACFRSW